MSALSNKEFFKQLESNPKLLDHFKKLFLIAYGNGDDEIKRADAAEEAVTLEFRGLGKNLLNEWASTQEDKSAKNLKKTIPVVKAHSKKNSAG